MIQLQKPIEIRLPRDYENPLCAQTGPSFFYIDDDDDDTLAPEDMNTSYATGISICGRCEHKAECADWGIKNERWGLWGGLTPHDRILLRRKLKIVLKIRD